MPKTCSECTYMDFCKEGDDGKFWCGKRLDYFPANNAECDRFCTAYSRDDSTAKSYKEYSKAKQSSSGGCYLTTATCEILGLDDKNIYLQLFRRFRKEYLQKNPEGLPILVQYDTVGPIIASRLRKDPNRKAVASSMLRIYIGPIAKMLADDYIPSTRKEKPFGIRSNYECAINQYAQMTQLLIQRYGLETVALTIPGEQKYDFSQDYSTYGHGKTQR